jgi:hypothetical protein
MFEARNPLNAQAYRGKARTCDKLAVCARSVPDRERFQRMRDGWLSRAANEDWLNGMLPPPPPANSNALAITRHASYTYAPASR